MSSIISIATGVPAHKHGQSALCAFADKVYSRDETDSRKLKFLYRQSGIEHRYSVIPDFTTTERQFFPDNDDLEPFPGIEKRMEWFNAHAAALSAKTIAECIEGKIKPDAITHLITVSCTGMSAPGLDLQLIDLMQLPRNIVRTSVNFMGCYAAVHALKLADAFCRSSSHANVVVVCTELCTLHFQKDISADNLTSSLLFGDGCAAVLIQPGRNSKALHIDSFYSDISVKGKKDMAWEISSKGFLMTLTGYVPELIKEDFEGLVAKALLNAGKTKEAITHWCIHPGGKKILEAIACSMDMGSTALKYAYEVLHDYGNMSSPTILFVLKKILDELQAGQTPATVFAAAFGPGLTMETFTASYA